MATSLARRIQAKISERDWLIAVRAASAEPQTSREEVTVWATSLADEAQLARRAFVDGQRHPGPSGWQWRRSYRLPPTPGGLATGRRAVSLATHWAKGLAAASTGHRYVIVTPRRMGHQSVSLVAAWARLAWGEVRLR